MRLFAVHLGRDLLRVARRFRAGPPADDRGILLGAGEIQTEVALVRLDQVGAAVDGVLDIGDEPFRPQGRALLPAWAPFQELEEATAIALRRREVEGEPGV